MYIGLIFYQIWDINKLRICFRNVLYSTENSVTYQMRYSGSVALFAQYKSPDAVHCHDLSTSVKYLT